MPPSKARSLLILLILPAVVVVGFAVAFAVTYVWPSLLLAGIVIACCAFIVALVGVYQSMGRRWPLWLVAPAVAIAGIGTIMLAEDLALSEVGELTEVVVVSHDVEQETVHDSNDPGGREVYTHEYTLEKTDGTPVDQPMTYRGKDGFDDIDEGDTITVMIDPAGKAPTEPADEVDVPADIGILVVGTVLTIGAFGVCTLVVALRPREPRRVR